MPLTISRFCILLATACIMAGCSSQQSADRRAERRAEDRREDELASQPLRTRVSRLRLGMTKAQVVAVMGDEGRSLNVSQSEHGTLETVQYSPGFGSRYVSALKSSYTFGLAGHEGLEGATLLFKNGHLSNISSF